jgi:drug/metabolite transporter (DMT)-like permease
MGHTLNFGAQKTLAIPILTIGLVSISFASIFIKLCQAPSIVIAFYRLAIASSLYWCYAGIRQRNLATTLNPTQLRLALLSGLFLAFHFATWIASLEYTSVASSVVLVQTSPIFVAIGSHFILREKHRIATLAGILVTILGALAVSLTDYSASRSSLHGNLLALAGAIGAAGYFLIGRKLRADMGTLSYVTIVYSAAALFILLLALAEKRPFFSYDLRTFALLAAIAIIPQMIGHTSLNWALKYFSATSVAIFTLGEPIGATFLAYILLGEKISALKLAGCAIILAGTSLVFLTESKEYKTRANVT